jgi:hypothetical protein
MPKAGKKHKDFRTTDKGKPSGWEIALQRAQDALRKSQIRSARLRAAIRLFSEKLRNGEPWPDAERR